MNLIRASAKGDLARVKKLIEEGADVDAGDSTGRTALLEAAWGGHVDVVKYLLDKGASVNAADSSGYTPLMRAAEEGHAVIVSLLIKKGADVNCRGKVRGSTPLMLAAERGQLKIVEMLIENGAKINAIDLYEETALARAYKAEQSKVISFLESKGAMRKPERSMLTHHDKDTTFFTKATIPKWDAAADDAAFRDEDSPEEEPFEEE